MRLIVIYLFFLLINSVTYSQNDAIDTFNSFIIDSLAKNNVSEVILLRKYHRGKAIGYGIADQKESCESYNEFIIFWLKGSKTNYILSDECYYSDEYSHSDSLYFGLLELFNSSDSTYTEYEIDSTLLDPYCYEINFIDSGDNSIRNFNIYGNNKVNQSEQIYLGLLHILKSISKINEKINPFSIYKYRIRENWH
jgi:hypothetical protein